MAYDPFGGDFEGIQIANDGTFWMCDEYRPAIYHFDAMGTLIERYVAEGTAQLGTEPQEAGFYGAETLPAVYASRRANRGFEALAYDDEEDLVYAFIQSPIENPDNSVRNNSDVIRILGVSASDGTPVSEYVYLLERNARSGVSAGRVDKIGDADYIGDGKFIVLERDSGTPDDEDGFESKKYVFEIDLTGATNILDIDLAAVTDTNTLEQMSADMLAAAGIQAVAKRKVLNLPSIGYLPSDKPEGLAMLPNGDIAVMNDNDFGLAGAGVSDKSSLGIIQMCADNSLDASNRSEGINIQNWPVQGFYMPDAIAAFESNGKTYIATANEGDARDYDGYSEEVRVEDLTLDPDRFPNAAELQMEQNLGRLRTTDANGDLDGDGDFDVIYSYGARSFSIFDEFGNLVYDSGNDFEQILAELDPDNFNSNNDENDSQKSRSDDKGPEPEAIEIISLDGQTYALVGLERQGGIMVYNISNLDSVYYVSYTNNRDFTVAADSSAVGDLGVEDIIFIDAANSPIDAPLVVTANEVSGTVSIFAVNDEFASSEFVLQILHNNDGESKLLPSDVGGRIIGGAAEFTTAIKELQADEFANITLSSGDNVLPGVNFNASLALPEDRQYYDVVVLEDIGYDALCIGNHDFDFGPDILANIINDFQQNTPPYLSANLNFMAEPNLQTLVDAGRIAASTIVEVDGEQIGVIGLSPPNLRTISTPRLVEVDTNTVQIAQDEIDALTAQGVNKIILISHLQGIDSEIELAPQLTGVDIIIAGGGDELLTNDPDIALPGISIRGDYPLIETDANGDPVYIVTTAGEYRYLGNLLVGFDDNGNVIRIGDESNPILIEGFAPDSVLQADVIDSIIAYNQGLADNIIATTEVDLDGLRESVRAKETNLGNMAADAFLSLANANVEDLGFTDAPIVAIQNGGGMRNNAVIAAGSEISEQTTFDILPFDNNVAILGPLTATEFKEMLEHAVSDVEGFEGRFLQVAGFEFVWDLSGVPGESRVFSAMLDDSTMVVDDFAVIEGAPSIYITLVDFLANGGDGYAVFEGKPFTRIGASYQRALFDYIVGDLNGLITAEQYPAGGEGRITLLEPVEDTTVVDIIAASAEHGFLATVLDQSGAAAALAGDGPFTVFAPNDAAFGELSDEIVAEATANPAVLESILGYHVLPAVVLSTDLEDGAVATTTNGEEVSVRIVDDSIFINGTAYVYEADLIADNGVVHFIDEVLLPPSLVNTSNLDLSVFDFAAMPNPFTDELNVSFNLEGSTLVRLDMFNLLGQQVMNITDSAQLNGKQSISIDTQDLPSGVYTIQLQIDGKAGHVKIVKQ